MRWLLESEGSLLDCRAVLSGWSATRTKWVEPSQEDRILLGVGPNHLLNGLPMQNRVCEMFLLIRAKNSGLVHAD
jgi:hypothetical protein